MTKAAIQTVHDGLDPAEPVDDVLEGGLLILGPPEHVAQAGCRVAADRSAFADLADRVGRHVRLVCQFAVGEGRAFKGLPQMLGGVVVHERTVLPECVRLRCDSSRHSRG